MNKVILLGRICNDLEIKKTNTNKSVVNFTIAVDRRKTKEKTTDFFNVIAWNRTAEFIQQYFIKGQQIAIVGNLQSRNWTDNNGQKRNSVEVIVEEVNFAGITGKKQEQTNEGTSNNVDNFYDEIDDYELPF